MATYDDLSWAGYGMDSVRTCVCNCGNVYRDKVQQADGVWFSYRPCVVCMRHDNIAAVFPKEEYRAKRAEAGLA